MTRSWIMSPASSSGLIRNEKCPLSAEYWIIPYSTVTVLTTVTHNARAHLLMQIVRSKIWPITWNVPQARSLHSLAVWIQIILLST